jgi:hypothetical protein
MGHHDERAAMALGQQAARLIVQDGDQRAGLGERRHLAPQREQPARRLRALDHVVGRQAAFGLELRDAGLDVTQALPTRGRCARSRRS